MYKMRIYCNSNVVYTDLRGRVYIVILIIKTIWIEGKIKMIFQLTSMFYCFW